MLFLTAKIVTLLSLSSVIAGATFPLGVAFHPLSQSSNPIVTTSSKPLPPPSPRGQTALSSLACGTPLHYGPPSTSQLPGNNASTRCKVKVHAVIELDPDAMAFARQLDKERKERKMRGPLHGLPILFEDFYDGGLHE